MSSFRVQMMEYRRCYESPSDLVFVGVHRNIELIRGHQLECVDIRKSQCELEEEAALDDVLSRRRLVPLNQHDL